MRAAKKTAEPYVPMRARSIAALRLASQGCRGCDLYAHATQAVMGEGPLGARLMLIGEQPGDREDQEGHPFVGPAGRELDLALETAGIPREDVYVTNVVKHFKHVPRGKRRVHSKPNASEIHACRPWLDREIEMVRPSVMVLLGATAAKAILGSSFRVSKERGQLVTRAALPAVATWHPSAILRAETSEERARLREELANDLALAYASHRMKKTMTS